MQPNRKIKTKKDKKINKKKIKDKEKTNDFLIFYLFIFYLVRISGLANLLGGWGRSPQEIFSVLPKRFTNFEHPKWNMIKQKYIGDHFKIKGCGGGNLFSEPG